MLDMPAAHRQALRMHYAEFPFGDFRTQQLLAQLIIMFHAANKDKKSKPLELKDVAPWLVTARMRRKSRAMSRGPMMQNVMLDLIKHGKPK